MTHPFEIALDLEVDATPEQVWEAIATGPGLGSWFLGDSEIEPRQGGTWKWSFGGWTDESTVSTWDPPNRLVTTGNENLPHGIKHQFDYTVQPREGGGSAIRYVHSGAFDGDDWETEYEAMSEGDPMYLFKLVQYLNHFPGRLGAKVDAFGPNVPDREEAMTAFRRGLGLADDVATGDRVSLTPAGVDPIRGEVDHVSPHFIGVLADDAIYRFIHGFAGETLVGHHIFAPGANRERLESEWGAWLADVFGTGGAGETPG
jgi:uncharacterized protein YndB with AHSA1/START domain